MSFINDHHRSTYLQNNTKANLNNQYYHPRVPHILNSSMFSPRVHHTENCTTSCCLTARTSVSVGDEPHKAFFEPMNLTSSSCRPKTSSTPYYNKYLEEKMIKIDEKLRNTLSENMNLKNQLSKVMAQNRELEIKAAAFEEALQKEKLDRKISGVTPKVLQTFHQAVNTITPGPLLEVSTSTENTDIFESSVQTLPIDILQQSLDNDEDLVSISKSELENLKNNVKVLRDAVRAKEDTWEEAIEREQSYREHLARLSVELITVRQQFEMRNNESQTLRQKLTEKEEELREKQIELNSIKKYYKKLWKRCKITEDSNNQGAASTNVENNSEYQEKRTFEVKHGNQASSTITIRNKSRPSSTTKDIKGTQRRYNADYSPRIEDLTSTHMKQKE